MRQSDPTEIERVAGADVAVFPLTAAGVVASWSDAAERLTGYRRQEILGRHFSVLHSIENLRREKPSEVLRAASADGHVEYADWHVRKDGSHFWASLVVSAAAPAVGKSTFTVEMRLASQTNGVAEKFRARNAELETLLGERTAELGERTAELGVRTEELGERTAQLGVRTGELGERTAQLGVRTGELGERTAELGVRTGELEVRTDELGVRTKELGVRTGELGSQTTQLGERTAELGERTAELGVRTEELGERTAQLGVRTGELGERTAQLGVRTGELGERTAQLGVRTGELGERTAELGVRTGELEVRTGELGSQTTQLGERTVQLSAKTREFNTVEALNKELEAFTYAASHDLRAPLRAIDGYSQVLLEDYSDKLDTEGLGHLERIRICAQRMGQLIDDLIGLSSLTRGTLKRAPCDLTAESRTIAEELQRQSPDRHVSFEIAPDMIVDGDVHLLRIALENLLGNAFKYTSKKAHAHISVGSRKVDGVVVYFVRDDGAGFDMKYAHKLFGAFQRLHNVSEFEGNGIGLATVQRVINRHGGEIWPESAVDKGTTMFFTL